MIEQKPLAGIRVIDLTRVLAGPFCTMNLADLGAEVIKIEMPGRGDDSRGFAPRMLNGDSGYFYSVNRGKKSVTIDLRESEGAALGFKLAEKSDVVVENFSPGTMARFGFGYDRLSALNPGIILCSISGFGQTGPMAEAPAYDIVAQALGGTMSITGYPGGDPLRCGVSIGDLTAALYAVIGIMAALRTRAVTGRGQHVDIAMLDCQVAILEDALARYSISGKVPAPLGTRHPSITPFQAFHASDGYFVMGAGNEAIWLRMCDAIGMPELKDEPRFKVNADRAEHHHELEKILSRRFKTDTRDNWLAKLEQAHVPCAPIASVEEVTRNPHLHEHSMILRADHPTFDNLIVPGTPLRNPGSTATPDTRAPRLGEHTEEVLSSVAGVSSSDIAELRARGII
ncbi:MAG TPA: CaiB/BaiF CoA-transferase family protein [Candidatus Binataceae bacterium]|nr:CaiB/BaiF CoA-transferase family protein [Candidatus Binataceae bacterium]